MLIMMMATIMRMLIPSYQKLFPLPLQLASINKQIVDPFVTAFCIVKKDEYDCIIDELEGKDADYIKPSVYHVRHDTQEQIKVVPLLGMKFSNPRELKRFPSNYAVSHGYDL